MHANSGDWLVVESTHTGQGVRKGLIVEARGAGGIPPFLVRWTESDEETLVFPGSDAHVVPAGQETRPTGN